MEKQGILYNQVLNSLILKIKDIVIFSRNFQISYQEVTVCQVSFAYEMGHKLLGIGTEKICSHIEGGGGGGGRKNTGNLKMKFE